MKQTNNIVKVAVILFITILAIILGTTKANAFPGFVYHGTDGYQFNENTDADNYNWGAPCVQGYQLYCINHGNHVEFSANTSINGLDDSYIKQLYENYIKTGTTYLKINNDSQAYLGSNNMNTYYYKNSNYEDKTLDHDLAYILSAYDYSNKEQRKTMQYAVWQYLGQGIQSYDDASLWYGRAKELVTEAKNYKTFIRQLDKERQTRDNKLIAYINAGKTEAKEITEDMCVVGDFKLSYTNGTYGNTTFGGITDMYLEGYDVNGNLVSNRIDITSVIVNEEEKALRLFTPNSQEKNDYGISQNNVYYPKSGSAFKVKFSRPENVVSVKLVTKYSYMKASGTYSKYDGVLATINVYRNSSNDKYIRLTNISRTQSVWDANAIRSMETETIVSEEIEVLQFIKLSGYVWEDEKAGKESTINGIKDNNEKYINGIKVTLHTKDGSNIVYVKEGNNIVKKDVQTLTTTTGMNNTDGYYEFIVQKNKAGSEYYVEFTYNGQNYQHTKYEPWSTTSSSNGKTSNATETESVRDGINVALEEITPSTTVKSTINEQGATYIGDSKCVISAYTGGYGNARGVTYYNDNSEEINLGITKREVADLALRKDVYKANLNIKGYSQEYIYNKRDGLETDAQGNSYWDVTARRTDVYYGASYTREVRPADYNYRGENRLGATVTYKITIRNQSEGIVGKVTEIVDYYDSEYSYIGAYIGDRNGNKIGEIIASRESRYGSSTSIEGYEKMYFTGIENTGIAPSGDMYIYVTLAVKTDAQGNIILDENDSGKGNITEIMGYKTYYEGNTAPNEGNGNTYTEYKAGDIAGRVDVDSNPGNATTADTSTYEDDTDRAPYIRFKLADEDRTTTGKIWVEDRNNNQGGSDIGDGIRQDDEPGLGDVKVELWDSDTNEKTKVWNGTQWEDGETTTSDNGEYTIDGFVPGNYYLKFIYQDGQNYKSTIYDPEAVFDVNNPDELGKYVETEERYSDARDIYNGTLTDNGRTLEQLTSQYRQYVNDLLPEETNGKLKEYETQDKSVQAVTGMIEVNIEKDPSNTSSDQRNYRLENIDFGIIERPKAQLMLTKEVSNVKVTLANGNTLFDASGKATNVLWQAKKYHEVTYEGNKLKTPVVSSDAQRIVLTMDEELMQGATITIKYALKVSNVGEIDYTGYNFYYKGSVGNGSIVNTTIKGVVNYVGAALSDDTASIKNNLKFNSAESENTGWEVVSLEYLYKGDDKPLVSEELLTNNAGVYNGDISGYNTIIQNKMGETVLTPQISSVGIHEVETSLVLSQVMSAQSSSDDMAYSTMAEIIKVSNDVGRRMAFSTVGNQSPNSVVEEIDADSSTVTVLPPFGQTYIYYILGIGIAVILIAGIILIKIKVIDKK